MWGRRAHVTRRRRIIHSRLRRRHGLLTNRRPGPRKSRRLLELERRRQRRGRHHRHLDALSSTDLIELVEVKARNMALEKGLALGDLVLDALSVAAGGECLAVAVFLVAWGARCGACSTAGMFRVALGQKLSQLWLEIAAGVARRDLPLFSCSYISHMPHEIDADDAAPTPSLPRRCLRLLFSASCSMSLLGATDAVAPAGP